MIGDREETEEESVASSARNKKVTNRSKAEMKCAVGSRAYHVSKTGGAAGDDAGKASWGRGVGERDERRGWS